MSEVAPGRSGRPLPDELGIGPGTRVALLHAPDGIEATLGPLPDDAELQHGLRRTDQVDLIVGFVTERSHLARNIGWLLRTLRTGGAFWVVWPRRASEVATDLTEDVVREVARPLGWVDTEACAIDDTWAGLKLVRPGDQRGG